MRKQAIHATAVAQHNGVLAEDQFDFSEGDRVMTVDGFPGKITAVLVGPYQGSESYQVELDNGLGGGDYAPGQLREYRTSTASRVEAVDFTASIPFEAVTDHTANIDYPELEDILEKRIPNERIKIKVHAAQNIDKAAEPDITKDDPGENLDQEDPHEEPNVSPVDDPEANPEAGPADEGKAQAGDVTPPSACSFCGNDSFSDQQMTGRGVRMRCDQCGGTMKSWGGQWEPEFPNSSQNHASETWDYRSGGPAGVASAPGANFKTTKLREIVAALSPVEAAESLQTEAGIISHIFTKLYERAREKYDRNQTEWWMPPANQVGTNLEGPAQYSTVTPGRVSVGSASDLDDPDWKWHFTASWLDVQAKARRIRRAGHVKIVSASRMFVNAEVQGDTALYETQLNYVPGTRKVADWACGCKWGSYTWGRSPAYRRFEGRLCSHALATQYEAGARGMFGREVKHDTDRDWQDQSLVVRYDKGNKENQTRPVTVRSFSSHALDSDGIYPEPDLLDLAHAPVYATVCTMLDNGDNLVDVIEVVAASGIDQSLGRSMVFDALLEPLIAEGMSQVGEGSESASALTTEASKQHHKVKHYPYSWQHNYWQGYAPCGLCYGIGCGHCDHGQVPEDHPNAMQPVDDDATDMPSGGPAADSGTTASIKTADYSTADPFVSLDGGHGFYPTVQHSNSENPASTGWATAQDPADWGRSLISNDFGVTFDAALHVTALKEGEGSTPTVSGVALKAADTGRVLMIQRSVHSTSDPAAGTWEFPGGHHEDGDLTSLHAGIREWQEEVGQPFPGGHLTHVHRNGPYVLHTIVTPSEKSVDFSNGRSHLNPDDPDRDDHEQAAWWDPDHAAKNPALRKEVRKQAPFGDIKKAATTFLKPETALDRCKFCGRQTEPEDEGLCQHCDRAMESGDYAGGADLNVIPKWMRTHSEPFSPDHAPDRIRSLNKGKHSLPNPNNVQWSWDVGRTHGYKWAEQGGPQVDQGVVANERSAHHETENPGMFYHYNDGFHDGANLFRTQFPRRSVYAVASDGYESEAALDFEGRLGDEAMFHEEPQGALPSTDGADEEVDADPGAGNTSEGPFDPSSDRENQFTTAQKIILEFQVSAAGQGLAKQAMKDFSFEEQQDLINEGKGERARNFSDLKITGTHYELIGDDDSDETILWV